MSSYFKQKKLKKLKPQNESDEEEDESSIKDDNNYKLDDFVVNDDYADEDAFDSEEETKPKIKKKKLRHKRKSKQTEKEYLQEFEDLGDDNNEDINEHVDDDSFINDDELHVIKKEHKQRGTGKHSVNHRSHHINDDEINNIDDYDDDDNQAAHSYIHAKQYHHNKKKTSIPHQVFAYNDKDDEDELIHHNNESHEHKYLPSSSSTINHDIMNMKSIYTAEEIEEQYATEHDMKIKLTDYPERLLLRYKEQDFPNLVYELERESEWIFSKMKLHLSFPSESIHSISHKILTILEMYKKEFLDIPYIITYQKYLYEPELKAHDIWKIFEYDKEWQELSDYKVNIIKQFNAIRKYLDSKSAEFMQERYIINAKSIYDLKSMEVFISFMKDRYFDDKGNTELNKLNQGMTLCPIKKSLVIDAVQNSISDFAEKYAMRASDLAVNLELIMNNEDITKLIPAPEPEEPLVDIVKMYISGKYNTEIAVIEQSTKYLATEMASHPFIREYVFDYFRSNGTLSTTPTELGKSELDLFNPSFRTKRVLHKPLDQFNDDLFLDIVQNEKKGLIKVDINIIGGEESLKSLKNRIVHAYMPNVHDNTNINSDNNELPWKHIREVAVNELIEEKLFKQFPKEIREELLHNAEKNVINECGSKFCSMLLSGPYRMKQSEINRIDTHYKTIPVVMSFVYEPSRKKTYSVILDRNGEMLDHHTFSTLAMKPPRNTIATTSINIDDSIKFTEERFKLKQLLTQYNPGLIIIGGNDLQCRILKEQINQNIIDNNTSNTTWIMFGDMTIPSLYANSPISDKAFPYMNMYYKQAISLGRLKQNPMEEILQLWNEDIYNNYCLKIPLHPLQYLVNQHKLANMLEMKAIQVVNSVGIDINRAFEYRHLRNTLMFISGLGPRKAQYIYEKMLSTNGITMRAQLLTIIGTKVCTSCNGFIKIKRDSLNDDRVYNLLDTTRINIDLYSLTMKLIKDALGNGSSSNNTNDNSKSKDKDDIKRILLNPSKLENIDWNEYIRRQTENQPINIARSMKCNVNLIKHELHSPFEDPRKPHEDPQSKEIFSMLINDDTFKEGQITIARVIKVNNEHVYCRLMNELEASLWINDIFDERPSKDEMYSKYKPGTLFEARIKQINYTSFKVDLITKPSHMISHEKYIRLDKLSHHFDLDEEDKINKKYKEATKEMYQKYIPRKIVHEKFKNINCKTCIDILRNKDIGEYMFRPSSKGMNNITLSWKFYKNVYSHIDIIEEDKTNYGTLSNKLRIGNEIYTSLNEIVVKFLKPCEHNVKDALQHRKFIECDNKFDVEKKLKNEKAKDNSIIHYYLTILREFPQYILLTYIPKHDVVMEYIKVCPEGFVFHGEVYKDVDEVIQFFKKNYGSAQYEDFVRKIQMPNVEYHRQLENTSRDGVRYRNDGVMRGSNSNGSNMFRGRGGRWGGSDGRGGQGGRGGGDKGFANIECRICHEKGHKAMQCPNKGDSERGKRGGRGNGNYNNNNNGGRGGGYGERNGFRGKRPRMFNQGGGEFNRNENGNGGYKKRFYDNNNNNNGGFKQNNTWANEGSNWGSNNNNNTWGSNTNNSGSWGNTNNNNNNTNTWGNNTNNNNNDWGSSSNNNNNNTNNNDTWGGASETNNINTSNAEESGWGTTTNNNPELNEPGGWGTFDTEIKKEPINQNDKIDDGWN